jgi:hypothetical protein
MAWEYKVGGRDVNEEGEGMNLRDIQADLLRAQRQTNDPGP